MTSESRSSSSTLPLLEESAQRIEDIESNGLEHQISEDCTVQQMFEEHQYDVLRYLQSSGIEKIAEFQVEDDIVFDAFQNEPFLVFGSDFQHPNDIKTLWRRHVLSLASKQRNRRPSAALGWHNQISVQAFVVTLKNACAYGEHGLIRPLVKQYQAQRCSYAVFSLPAVQAVIAYKWKTFARRILMIQLSIYVLWLSSYYLYIAAIHGEDLCLPLHKVWQQSLQGKVAIISELVSLISMAPFLFLDCISLTTNYGIVWFYDPSKLLHITTYIFQLLISLTHLGRLWISTHWLTYLLSTQCIILMFRLQYFTQCFDSMKFSFSTVIRQVLIDLRWVFFFIFLTCFAYGAAVYVAFRQEYEPPEEFQSFMRAVLAMFEHVYGDIRFKDFVHVKKNPIFITIVAISYVLFMGYVLINLILGYIIDSLKRVLEHQDAKQLCNQAKLIDEIESVLPWLHWLMHAHTYNHHHHHQQQQQQYTNWFPEYVHILRIDPGKLDSVVMDALWTRHGDDVPVMNTSAVSTGKRVHATSGIGGGDSNSGGSGSGNSSNTTTNINTTTNNNDSIERLRMEVEEVKRLLKEQQVLMQSIATRYSVNE